MPRTKAPPVIAFRTADTACNFCGEKPVTVDYGCDPHRVDDTPFSFDDDRFSACAACAAIIDQGSRDLLFARGLERAAAQGVTITPTVRGILALVQTGFW